MVAVLVLTPEERAVLLEGGISEPRYRPFPGGRRERELEMDEDDALFDDLGSPTGTGEVLDPTELMDQLGAQARTNTGEVLDFTELIDQIGALATVTDGRAPVRDDRPSATAELSEVRFDRIAAAQHWNRSSVDTTLVFARRPEAVKRFLADGDELELIAVARATAGPRTAEAGVRRLVVGPFSTLTRPLAVTTITNGLPAHLRATFLRILAEPARPLPRATAAAVAMALVDLVEGFAAAIQGLHRPAERRRRLNGSQLQQRDAVTTALRIFTTSWRSLTPEPEPHEFDLVDFSANSSEDDAITDDAAVFPGWDRSARSQRGWWEFRSRGRRLLLKNINVSTAESRTGADLVYARRDPDALVLVQYKLMDRLEDGQWVFRPRTHDRLVTQIEKLHSLADGDVAAGAEPADHRLGPGYTFVKFLEGNLRRGLLDDELTPGYYLPTELVARLMRQPGRGPRGGNVIYVRNGRYIDTQTFVKLVQDSWIGSTGPTTDLISRIVGLVPASDTGNRIFAVDEPLA